MLIISLAGCGSTETTKPESTTTDIVSDVESNEVTSGETTAQANQIASEDMFSDGDLDWNYDESECIAIDLSDGSQTITSAGIYLISGTLANGQLVVDCGDDDKVHLVLDSVSISCGDSAAIYIKNADKVFVTLADGTENDLTVTTDISDNEDGIDSVVYSKCDLTFNGSGSLTVTSDYAHGIVVKDDVVFAGGTYSITASGDGIQANDSVRTVDSEINIVSGKDGIQAKNNEDSDKGFIYCESTTLNMDTAEDALSAVNYIYIISGSYTISSDKDGISADTFVQISGGSFDITTGGGFTEVLNSITMGEGSDGVVSETDKLTESMKAIKGNNIIVEQGDITISSYEDAINANNNITISDGTILINSGDEALTAKNTVEIGGGTITIENGYEGIEGIYINISGGNISINVLDDGLNGNEDYSVVTISGGNLSVTCQGDGLDSNGDLVISGGYFVLDVSAIYTGGDGDIDVTGTVAYTGGTIVDESGNAIDPTVQTGTMQPGGIRPGDTQPGNAGGERPH